MELAWKFGVIALIALALVVLPGGGNALDVVLTALTILFFAAIALLVARLYRQYRLDIDSLDPNIRLALYGSLAIAVLTFTGTDRLFNAGGAGVLPGSRCSCWRPTASSGRGLSTDQTRNAVSLWHRFAPRRGPGIGNLPRGYWVGDVAGERGDRESRL